MARINFSDKMVITPLPVLLIATYDENGNADVMNAAWGGQCGGRMIAMYLSKHQTTENIRLKKAFTVSFADQKNMTAADYVGLVSAAAEPNKMAKAGFHAVRSEFVDAPLIAELPLTVECRLLKIQELFGENQIIGEIVNMSADESILNEDMKVDLDKLQPLVFDSAQSLYRSVGKAVGRAFQQGMKLK